MFLGRTIRSKGAERSVPEARVNECLLLHQQCNWGIADEEARAIMNEQLIHGGRVLSAWQIDPAKPADGADVNTFWIVTDGPESPDYPKTGILTTVLLPSEYA